tara:strand:+ start:132 stop:362 length:231 start_codon:yes stop_codon:yes gene_type:complete
VIITEPWRFTFTEAAGAADWVGAGAEVAAARAAWERASWLRIEASAASFDASAPSTRASSWRSAAFSVCGEGEDGG